MAAVSETEAIKAVNKMKHKVNHVTVGMLCDKLLFGVALTTAQMTLAAETLYHFFHDNGAGHLIKGIVLKTAYRIELDGSMTKLESWLETYEGYRLNNFDLDELRYKVPW